MQLSTADLIRLETWPTEKTEGAGDERCDEFDVEGYGRGEDLDGKPDVILPREREITIKRVVKRE